MGFFKKTPEEIAAHEDQRRAVEFANSPAGQAKAAKEAGASLFQIYLPLSTTTAFVVPLVGAFSKNVDSQHVSVLDSIERQGWKLEHAGYVFRVTGSESRDKFFASGQQEALSGQIIGIYLFRARG